MLGYLGPRDFCALGAVNRQMHFICAKVLKREYLGIMIRHKNDRIAELSRDMEEYERMFDNFPSENIRTNAIKYLFYKIKPGTYMLPYFQDDEPV